MFKKCLELRFCSHTIRERESKDEQWILDEEQAEYRFSWGSEFRDDAILLLKSTGY